MLKVPSKIGLPVTETSGMDCLEFCLDKDHFQNYKKKINYKYNSKGFRDEEWPANLSDCVWCLGDSFTVGIGQPFDETWPKVLENTVEKRCLNLGENGCSNDTLARRASEVIDLYNPNIMVIMWSYFARRRVGNKDVQYDKDSFGATQDLINFSKNFTKVDQKKPDVIHLLIPHAFIDDQIIFKTMTSKKLKLLSEGQFDKILFFKQIDYARDFHHFDIKTSQSVCNMIAKAVKDFDKTSK